VSDLIQLASLATSVVAPQLPALTAFVAGAAGKKVIDKGIDGGLNAVKSIWDAILARFTKYPKAVRAAEDLALDPNDPIHRSTFASRLADILRDEPDFQAELESLLALPLTQRIVADGGTVRDAEQIASAVVNSQQEIIARPGSIVERVVQKVTDGRSNT